VRRLSRTERGAAAVVVALLAVPLLGLGALVIDVGAIYQERRELQNGADAAALALARDCAAAAGCGNAISTAAAFADVNANDGAAQVDEVCGAGGGLAPCPDPPPAVPGGTGWVRVRTSTRGPGGLNQLTHGLARVLTDQTGTTVRAGAVAAWGSAWAKITTQLTISECEYDAFTDPDGDGVPTFATGPPFATAPRTVYFHSTTAAGTCPAGPSGADLPGGFGWLLSTDCGALIGAGNWVPDKTGNAVPSGCHPADWRNKTILLPVYDDTNGLSGSNGSYHVAGFAAFHVTGYRFPSEKWPSNMKCKNAEPDSSTTCLVGHFVTYVTSADSFGGGSFGVTAVKLVS
jgi:hypothetical protein